MMLDWDQCARRRCDCRFRLWACFVAGIVFAVVTAIEAAEPEGILAPEDTSWIMITDADGSNMRRLAHGFEEFEQQGSPCWSGDGKQIAFDAWCPQKGESVGNSKIVIANTDGTKARILIDGCMPSFSPAGKRIAFSRQNPNSGVWIMNTDAGDGGLVLVDAQGWGIDWAPDGKRLAYIWHTTGGANMTVVDLVEGSYHEVFEGKRSPYRMIDYNFTWSPDGKKLLFRGVTPINNMETVIVDVNGSKFGLTSRPHPAEIENHLSWRAEGNLILVTGREGNGKRKQMLVFDPTKPDAPKRLSNQNPDLDYTDASFSPDGRSIVVSVEKPKQKPNTK